MCTEDVPFFDRAVVDPDEETFLGPVLARNTAEACESWPRGEVSDEYHDYIASDTPVLLVSGDVDPVTPPVYAERAAQYLPNGLHVVIPNTGHMPTAPGCVADLLQQFIEEGSVDGLEIACVQDVRRPDFVIPSGAN